jgi:hypothetical protein
MAYLLYAFVLLGLLTACGGGDPEGHEEQPTPSACDIAVVVITLTACGGGDPED